MNKKSFFLRNVAATVVCLSVVTLFSGCSKNADENVDEPFNHTITGQIDNVSDYSNIRINSITQIKAYDYSSDFVLATGVFQNGNFSFTLPETVENSYLTPFTVPSSVQFSDANVKQTHVNVFDEESTLKLYDNHGNKVGKIVCKANTAVIYSYLYVDRDCRMTGSRDDLDYGMIVYNMNFKTGWNIVYLLEKGNRNFELTTTKPNVAMKWIAVIDPERFYGGTGTFTSTMAADQPLTVDAARYGSHATGALTFDKDDANVNSALYFNIWFPGQATGVPLPAGTYHFRDYGMPEQEYGFYCQTGSLGGVRYYGSGGTLTVAKSSDTYTITVDMDAYSEFDDGSTTGKIQGTYTGYLFME